MNATEQTIQQVERALRRTAEKFPSTSEADRMTDIHIVVSQETGELKAFDDDDNELMRCVVEQWISNTDEDFYSHVSKVIRGAIVADKENLEGLSILRPFSFVLEDDDREHVDELYVVDDEIGIIEPLSMDSIDKDLDDFLGELMK
jgi:hypothetical protein